MNNEQVFIVSTGNENVARIDTVTHASSLQTEPFRPVSLRQAARLTAAHRTGPYGAGRKGGFFGRGIFEAILAQRGCAGLRVRHGAGRDGLLTVVLAGVNEQFEDMETGLLGEDIVPCPPNCAPMNPLNSDGGISGRTRSTRPVVFSGTENHFITRAEALQYVLDYERLQALRDSVSGVMGDAVVRALIDQTDAVGLRVYFGRTSRQRNGFVLVGADSAGDDLVSGPIYANVIPADPTV